MAINLTGMASGLDTESIITQLMAIERQPQNRLTNEQRRAEGRKIALDDIARQLRGLKNAATDLKSTTTWGDTQTASTADATKLTARTMMRASATAGSRRTVARRLTARRAVPPM